MLPRIKCQLHTHSDLDRVCLAPTCDERLLCQRCQAKHAQKHQSYIQNLSSVFRRDFKELVKKAQEAHKNAFDSLVEVENILDTAYEKCKQILHQEREKITINSKELSDFEKEHAETIAELKRLRSHILGLKRKQENSITDEDMYNIEKYVEKLVDFDSAVHERLAVFNFSARNLINQFKEMLDDLAAPSYKNNIRIDPESLKLKGTAMNKSPIWGDGIEIIESKNLLVLGGKLGELTLWDNQTYKMLYSIKAHSKWISNIKYSRKVDHLFTCSIDNNLNVYKVSRDSNCSIRLVKRIPHIDSLYCLLPLESRNVLITSGKNMGMKLWDLKTLRSLGEVDSGGKLGVGTQVLYIEKYNMLAAGFYGGYVGLYDVESWKELTTANTNNSSWFINSLAYIEKQDLLFACVEMGRLRCWKIHKAEEGYFTLMFLRDFRPEGSDITFLIPVNNEKKILLSNLSVGLHFLDLESGHSESILELKHIISGVKILPKSKRLVVVGYNTEKVVIYSYK